VKVKMTDHPDATTKCFGQTKILVGFVHDAILPAKCRSAPPKGRLSAVAGRDPSSNFFRRDSPHNPLKRFTSDERIQGIQGKPTLLEPGIRGAPRQPGGAAKKSKFERGEASPVQPDPRR
jgi:hypothetical protein